mmetsp:Transcript_4468/g.6034  ORF Transcript_4468/g.6034 Transcript_4468/m.6034 type:complete len:232 (-) Transcript_4468:87-782(-)|eukprot:CAMPEP_0196584656 /NCGR_PEP_ID=MMETSP1081-20130531/47973_1 /TAXON_ID=36882 /ORGANISM="Pyramimonas amylifera, Strain CCMP720" /LENGTH=231 /DNA_ID=CAMNT_0041905941 /DNA_START=146 /DNA_END=838 /DNA_ORIENTATION=-
MVSLALIRANSLWIVFSYLAIHVDGNKLRRLHNIIGSTSGETKPFRPDPKLVEGLIQAGFTRAQAAQALNAVGNDDCCQPQIHWLFENSKSNKQTVPHHEKECHMFENTDFDGYAVIWGSQNLKESAAECCQSCKDYVPVPPSYYPCNIWVWCGHGDGCFAPAAGEFKYGQCWLKYQDSPENPQVNMKGDYSPQYRASHHTAPRAVQWTAGVVVGTGIQVSNGTWSSRSHW